MEQFVYPAILYLDQATGNYIVAFPDLNVFTEGESVEEAFLNAKEYLKAFFECVKECGDEIDIPTEYVLVKEENTDNIVLLVDAII